MSCTEGQTDNKTTADRGSFKVTFRQLLSSIMQQSMRHDNINNGDAVDASDYALLQNNTTATSRRRRRSATTAGSGGGGGTCPNSSDVYASGPWQAMKRLRVDAPSTVLAAAQNHIHSGSSNDTMMMITSPIVDVKNTTTCTQPQLHPQSSERQYLFKDDDDSHVQQQNEYHCYQRHQRQETGQDTEDGWNTSPESSSSPKQHRVGNNAANTATTYAASGGSQVDLDYQNVNHILGNLHFERQQRNHGTTTTRQPQQRFRYGTDNHFHETSPMMSDVDVLSTGTTTTTTFPPTPLNSRMMRQQQQFMQSQQHLPQQQHRPVALQSSSYNNNHMYHTPPPKPTKRNVKQLLTNSKLG